MIKLLVGEDSFITEKNLRAEIEKAENDFEIIGINKEDIDSLPNKLLTSSFFTEKRLFTVKNGLEKVSPNTEKKLIGAFSKIGDDTRIIFVENKMPKGALLKTLKEKAHIVKSDKPQEKDIISYIKSQTKSEGGEISPLAAERLFSFVGADYHQLGEEIKKLVLYKKSNKEDETIQATDIDELVKSSFESNIFELMDAISAKNTKRSQTLMSAFLESGENAIYILTMIARQFRNIAMAKMEPNINQQALAKKAGIHPFVAKKSISQAKNFEEEEIVEIYEKIKIADLKLKSGFEPSHVLEDFVIN